MMLDQSPLGVDAAHKRVVLQHFLKTWRKYVHSQMRKTALPCLLFKQIQERCNPYEWMCEYEVVVQDVALN